MSLDNLKPPYTLGEDMGTDFIQFYWRPENKGVILWSLRDLHVYRVSDGNMYNDIAPMQFQDTTVPIPGGDGSYYFDTRFSQRNINIKIAFDSLNEAGINRLRTLFNGKATGRLNFSEVPYKTYMCKVAQPIQLTYVPFGERAGERIYKGEGTISFISYKPYIIGFNTHKTTNPDPENSTYIRLLNYNYRKLDEYRDSQSAYRYNIEEWAACSRMPENFLIDSVLSEDNPDKYLNNWSNPRIETSSENLSLSQIHIYNAGDVETPLNIFLKGQNGTEGDTYRLVLSTYNKRNELTDANILGLIEFTWPTYSTVDNPFISFNGETRLIQRCSKYSSPVTNTLMNSHIIQGDFFNLSVCETPCNADHIYTVTCQHKTSNNTWENSPLLSYISYVYRYL